MVRFLAGTFVSSEFVIPFLPLGPEQSRCVVNMQCVNDDGQLLQSYVSSHKDSFSVP